MGWNLIGQERAVEVLWRGVESGRISHAYLLTGLPRVGKTTLALTLAQALNCTEAERPCQHCRACRLIARGGHPDVRTVELREGKKLISFAEITELQHDAALRPMEGRYKVYMILDAEELSETAANQLLKTLEEPPETVVLVLTAAEAESLLPTIVSRCQEIQLGSVPRELLRQHLQSELHLEAPQAELIARLAAGRAGWALEAARDQALLDERDVRLDELRQLLDGDRLTRLRIARGLAERWSSKRDLVREALLAWISWWRDLVLIQGAAEGQVVNLDELESLHREAARFGAEAGGQAIARLEQALDDLERNVNPRLALDVALLSLPRRTARA